MLVRVTTGSSWPWRHRCAELDLAQNTNTVYGGGVRQLSGGARGRPPAPAQQLREGSASGEEGRSGGPAHTMREWSSRVCCAMKKSPDNDKIRRRAATESGEEAGAEGASDGEPDLRLDEGRRTPQGVESPVHHRCRAAVEFGGRHPRQRRCAAGDFVWGRSRSRSTPENGSASPDPTAPANRRCCGCSSAGCSPTRAARGLGSANVAIRRDRPGPGRFHQFGSAGRPFRAAGAGLVDS